MKIEKRKKETKETKKNIPSSSEESSTSSSSSSSSSESDSQIIKKLKNKLNKKPINKYLESVEARSEDKQIHARKTLERYLHVIKHLNKVL